ncbi:MAG: TlpA family protein disulfide reductase [Candidatus Omnitrophica bacterium]|nr:TlpA family protein disulfide reductase [Candidatus Omnitrophota bacterium]
MAAKWQWAVLIGCLLATTPVTAGEGLNPAEHLPAFSVLDLNGRTQSSSAYRGKVLVLHFWATWCPYCRGEIPKLKRLYEEWASRGVAVLTVSMDKDIGTLKQFIQQQGLRYPVIADRQGNFSLASRYQISGVPITFIVRRDGTIAHRLMGPADLVGLISRLLSRLKR